MSLQYVKSKKGRDQLLYKGYLHTKERVFGNKTVWKCASYHRDHCRGRAHTCDGRVIKYSFHHHPPGKPVREVKRIEHRTKTATPSDPQLTHSVVSPAPTSSGLSGTIPTKRPCSQNPKKTMQRLRECLNATRPKTCHSQTSAMVAESVPKDPSSVLSVTPPNLPECSETDNGGISMASPTPMLCEEPEASHSVHLWASQEAGRQRFRLGTVPPGANPQEILFWISKAAREWLCPQERDKDQIVDMVILEQFLAVLPVRMQDWVKAREPRSSLEAVQLAETYVGDQEPATASQELEEDLVTFKDVSVHFSEEEWALLDHEKKALYLKVLCQNYDNVAWLTGGGTDSKRVKDPWQEASESTLELWETSNNDISWGVMQDSIGENHLERQPKRSSVEKEDASLFTGGLKEITRDADPGLETVYVCCREAEESSSIVASRKSPREEDTEPAILKESSGGEIPQNPEENVIKEGQKDVERQQSDNPGVEENLIPFRGALRDHQESGPGQETLCMAVDGDDQDESLTPPHDQSITLEENLECVALPEGLLFMSEEDISQSPEKDSQPEPIHFYSLSELNRTCSGEDVNGTAALISQKTIILDREHVSSTGKEGGEVKSILSGNGFQELTEGLLLLGSQTALEPLPIGPNPEESSDCNNSQKSSQGDDLSEGPSNKRQFIQNSVSTKQPTCSDSEGNSGSLSVLVKHRFDKKTKPYNGRNMPRTQWRTSSRGKLHKYLKWNWWASRKRGCRFPELHAGRRKHSSVNSNAQPRETLQAATEEYRTTSEAAFSSDTREAKSWQRAPSSSLQDKMADGPVAAQLMAVLVQVAKDTAEIKSVVSRLDLTVTGIQNALGNLSGCTDDAQHRILDLEFTSRNTKAQLVQHCNDIKAIEAKLPVGKAVQTNVIAGLWPRGIKREMSP